DNHNLKYSAKNNFTLPGYRLAIVVEKAAVIGRAELGNNLADAPSVIPGTNWGGAATHICPHPARMKRGYDYALWP
ncbi:MAG: hypothetical protein VCB63_10715, partial [Alphaproteobacteria bacterium]